MSNLLEPFQTVDLSKHRWSVLSLVLLVIGKTLLDLGLHLREHGEPS